MRDPRIWGEDSDEFKPERFLAADSDNLPDMSSVPFGFGRRQVVKHHVPQSQGKPLIVDRTLESVQEDF